MTDTCTKLHLDNLVIDKDGKIDAQQLESDPGDTTKIYLGHISLGFKLSASIEWKASMDYINKLKSAFAIASNMLYDVTNGQAYIEFVTIYDDKANWENADIRIYANNTQWPKANVKGIKCPGNGLYFFTTGSLRQLARSYLLVQRFYEANPIDPSGLLFVEAMVHELGHYAFGFYDEYENPKGAEIYPDFNFGFYGR